MSDWPRPGTTPHATCSQPEDHDDDDGHEDADQHDPIQLEGCTREEHHRREELTDVGSNKTTAAAAFAGEREDEIECVGSSANSRIGARYHAARRRGRSK
jgi:hypothetical protein